MPAANTGVDLMRFMQTGAPTVEQPMMFAQGTVPGVAVLLAAAINGPGIGSLRMVEKRLSWRAPGSGSFGPAVPVDTDGTWFVVDGDNANKYLRVQSWADYVPGGSHAARVRLGVRPGLFFAPYNGFPLRVPPFTLTGQQRIRNTAAAGGQPLVNVVAWLETGTGLNDYLTIGPSAIGPWTAPTTEAAGVNLADIPAASSVSLWWKVDAPGGAAANPAKPVAINVRWDGPP